MTREQYQIILRLLAALTAVALWGVSVYFSADGFGIKVPSVAWIGIILALSITVIELVFNREGFNHNYVLIIAGVAAYAYGIYTNIIGIQAAQQSQEWTFPVILAVFLEIVPEPLLVWSLMGVTSDDVISKLFGKRDGMPIRTFPPMGPLINERPPGFITTPRGKRIPSPPRR